MHVCAQAHVVGQIPADMIGVLIDHDAIAIPVPIVTGAIVESGHIKVESIKPKSISGSSSQGPNMVRPKPAVESSMHPWALETIVIAVMVTIMPDPSAVIMDVRKIRMSIMVAIATLVPIPIVVSITISIVFAVSVSVAIPVVIMVVVIAKALWASAGNVFIVTITAPIPVIAIMFPVVIVIVAILSNHIERKREQRD